MSCMHKTITLSLDKQLLKTVDNVRGDIPRSRFMRRALEAAVREKRETEKNEAFKQIEEA
jgi:metal-responsive CopG/Arc/MetJ family transcriptional regulator